jgi:hypothetical protein
MDISKARELALALPGATEEPHFEAASFRVRGKIFATLPPGGQVLHVFVSEEVRERELKLHAAFLEKLLWGQKVRGLRVLLAKAQPLVVDRLLREAWTERAVEPRSRGGAAAR